MGPIKEIETRTSRTYRGGMLIDRFLGKKTCEDSFQPEDWISSFTEAKNRNYIPDEGITRVLINDEEKRISDVIGPDEFGQGRTEAGVLVKFLDSAERLGIQVHPTKAYALREFDSPYGKTEAWYVLDTRENGGTVYLGFKEFVTKELWNRLFLEQDIQGLLSCLHCLQVHKGDVILVTGGTPHAIGAGCFLLEIQEPSDYTMRAEKVTLAGEVLTPNQIHYGVGEEKMLECFEYIPRTEKEIRERFFLKPKTNGEMISLIDYSQTPCFALSKTTGEKTVLKRDWFTTVISLNNGGRLINGDSEYTLKRGDKYFIPAGCEIVLTDAEVLVCEPPELKSAH